MRKFLIILFQLLTYTLIANDITCFSNISELNKYEWRYFSGESIYTGGSDSTFYIWKLNKGITIPRKNILTDKD